MYKVTSVGIIDNFSLSLVRVRFFFSRFLDFRWGYLNLDIAPRGIVRCLWSAVLTDGKISRSGIVLKDT